MIGDKKDAQASRILFDPNAVKSLKELEIKLGVQIVIHLHIVYRRGSWDLISLHGGPCKISDLGGIKNRLFILCILS